MEKREKIRIATALMGQSVKGAEMLRLFGMVTMHRTLGANVENGTASLNGDLRLSGLEATGFVVNALTNGEYTSIAVLKPGQGISETTTPLTNLANRPDRLFALRTGFLDYTGELVLDPERFEGGNHGMGDVVYLASITGKRGDWPHPDADRAFNEVSALARRVVLSELPSRYILETE